MKEEELIKLEKKLWESADKMRGAVPVSDYKFIILGLIFLKYISDSPSYHNLPSRYPYTESSLKPYLRLTVLRKTERTLSTAWVKGCRDKLHLRNTGFQSLSQEKVSDHSPDKLCRKRALAYRIQDQL